MERTRRYSIDYLLKPIQEEHLRQALYEYSNMANVLPMGLSKIEQVIQLKYRSRILCQHNNNTVVVSANEVAFISLKDSLVNVYLKDGSSHYAINLSLAELEAELDPNALFRANRQEIVKISEISGFQSETVRKGILGVISKLTRYNNEYFFLIEVARSLFYSYLCIANGNSKDSKNTQYIIRH